MAHELLANEAWLNIAESIGHKDLRSMMFIFNLAQEFHPAVILELGTGQGCSALAWHLGSPDSQIVSIDSGVDQPTGGMDIAEQNILKCVGEEGYFRILLRPGSTFEIAAVTPKPSIVFMDASHNKSDLIKEHASVSNVVADDHIIVVDDVWAADVEEFVDYLVESKKQYDGKLTFPFHHGMAVLSTNAKYNDKILAAAQVQ